MLDYQRHESDKFSTSSSGEKRAELESSDAPLFVEQNSNLPMSSPPEFSAKVMLYSGLGIGGIILGVLLYNWLF